MSKLKDIVDELQLAIRCTGDQLERRVSGGYASDLLSDVIANSKPGNLWITMQTHVNIVAVAVLKELAAIVIVQGREPAEETLKKAREEKVTLLVSKYPAYETSGRLYSLGIGST